MYRTSFRQRARLGIPRQLAELLSDDPEPVGLRGAPDHVESPGPNCAIHPEGSWGRFVPSPRQLFLILGAYFGVQILIRVLISPSVDLDESEQILHAQRLAWGYGASPPLYTWLQTAVFALTGQSIFGLALLKNFLLFGTYLLAYFNARAITGRHEAGLAAAVSLLFIPQIVWESQRDLTHSVLASALAIALLSGFIQIQRHRRASSYLVFGLVAGLGLLSKLNFGLWLLGLMAAAISTREFRAALLDRRMVAAGAVAVLVLAPYGIWAWHYSAAAFGSLSKLNMAVPAGHAQLALQGFRRLLVAALSFAGPLIIAHAILFRGNLRIALSGERRAYAVLIMKALLMAAGIALAAIFLSHSTGFRGRWFQPLFVNIALLSAMLMSERLTPARLRSLTIGALIVMALVSVLIPARIMIGHRLHREEPLMRPYPELASQFKPTLPPQATLVAEDMLLGGNLRLALKDVTVITRETAHLAPGAGPPWVLVWDANQSQRDLARFPAWTERALKIDITRLDRVVFSAPYPHSPGKSRSIVVVQSNPELPAVKNR